MSETAARVHAVIVESLCIEIGAVADDKLLMDDLGADSLEVVAIAVDVEKQFDIEFTNDEIGAWRTVGDVVATVVTKVPA